MKYKNFNEILKGTIGIVFITVLGIVFFMFISLNKALEEEVSKGHEFLDLSQAHFLQEVSEISENASGFFSYDQMIYIVSQINSDKMTLADKRSFEDQADLFFASMPMVKSVALEYEETHYRLTHDLEDNFNYSESLTWSMPWLTAYDQDFKFQMATHRDESILVVKIPLLKDKAFNGMSMVLYTHIDSVVEPYWKNLGYQLDLIDQESQQYYSQNPSIGDYLTHIDIRDTQAQPFFKNGKTLLNNSDLKYWDGHLFFVKHLADGYYFLMAKPYDKFSLKDLEKDMYTHILIYMFIGMGIIGFLVFNHEKTKKWIDKDRVFLNEIIDLDKIQISEFKKELKFYQNVVNEGPIPTIFVDKNTLDIINVNQEALAFYGYTEEELLGFHLSDICQWEDDSNDELVDIVHLKSGDVIEKGCVRVQEISFNDNELLVLLVVLDKVEKIVENRDMKVELFHEIRSPLQGAYGAVDLIDKASDAYKDYTNIIKQSLNSVLLLTENILSEGKLKTPHERVVHEAFDLVAMVKEVVELTLYQDKHFNGITGKVVEKIGLDWQVTDTYRTMGDPSKTRQILINLMTNASKYTQDGQVNLVVEVNKGIPKDHVVFKVQDTGQGMSETDQKDLFTSYTTCHDSSQITSTGIGLFVCKKYVELLGGSLHLISGKDQGSTFSFTLALEAVDETTSDVSRVYNILVLDDDAISCRYLKHLLEKEVSCFVKTITDEGQILSELSHRHYDLLVIDEHLNHFMGHDLISLVKKSINKRLEELPMILMSASVQSPCEAYQVITKPFDNQKIIRLVQKLLTKQMLYPYLDLEVIDPSILCETYESVGQEVFYSLLDKFIVTSATDLETIEGQIYKENFQEAGETLHRLKGSMSYFGSRVCQKLVADLEQYAKGASPVLSQKFVEFLSEFEVFVEALKFIHNKMTP